MRVLVCALLMLGLGACGQNAAKGKGPDRPSAETVELGPVLARGEPGWRLDIDREQGMSLSAGQGGQTWAAAYAPAERTPRGYRYASGALIVELTNAGCIAAGESYPMRAEVRAQGGEPLSGCATVRWDAHLLQLIDVGRQDIADRAKLTDQSHSQCRARTQQTLKHEQPPRRKPLRLPRVSAKRAFATTIDLRGHETNHAQRIFGVDRVKHGQAPHRRHRYQRALNRMRMHIRHRCGGRPFDQHQGTT